MKIRKILIGIDESEFSRYAAAYGFDIAHTYGAEVGLVHIVEPIVVPADTQDGLLGGMPFDTNLTFQAYRTRNIANQPVGHVT
jgi:nucleotide-binding universal stress UspA family protein